MKKTLKFTAIYLSIVISFSLLISHFSYAQIGIFDYNLTLTSNILGGSTEISFDAKLYKGDELADESPSVSISSSKFLQITFRDLASKDLTDNLKIVVKINEGSQIARFRDTERDTFESEVFSITSNKTISMGYIDVARYINIEPRDHGTFEKEQYYVYAGDKLPKPNYVESGYVFTGFTLDNTNNYANEPSPISYKDNDTYYACYEKRIGFDIEVIDSKVPFTGRSILPKVKVTYNGEVISSENYFVADGSFVEAGIHTFNVYGLNEYEYYEGSSSFEIVKANPILKFNNSSECEANLEDQYFVNTAFNNFNAKFKYEIISGKNLASIDEDSGVVSFISSGNIVVKASIDATSNYNSGSITYNLKINKRKVLPLFKYKVIQITNKNNLTDNELLNVSGVNVTYSSYGQIGEVNTNTGKVTLNGKKGFLKVTALISNNSNNISYGNSSTVKVSYIIYMVGTDKIEYKAKNYVGTYLDSTGNLIETSSEKNITYKVNNEDYSGNLNLGDSGTKRVYYKIQDNNNIIASGSVTVVLNRKNINTLQFSTLNDVKYNTVFQRPSIELVDSGKILTENDISISYQNNLHKGIGIVWIRGINNYTGSHILTFNILPIRFSENDMDNSSNEVIFFPADETPQRVYTSKEMIVEDFNVANYDNLSSVKSGVKKVLFKRGIDYDITYYNNIKVNATSSTGSSGQKAYIENAPSIKVVGKGDIEGVGYYNYGITERTKKSPYYLEKINFEYTKEKIVLPRGLIYVANDGITSKIQMANNDGRIYHRWYNTYTSLYQCKKYESNAMVPFKWYKGIGEQKISIQIYAANPNLEFSNGKITKKYGDNDFKNEISFNHDDNYSLKYYSSNGDVASVDDSGNVHINGAGTASIFAQLDKENNYEEGVSSYEITVNPKSITNDMISYEDNGSYKKTGYEICPIIINDNNNELIENKDYIIEYSNNIDVGTATAVITGIGNYDGTITKTFEILKNDELPDDEEEPISPKKIIYTLPSNDITYNGLNQSTSPIIVSEPVNAKIEYKLANDTSFSTNPPKVKNANLSGYEIFYRISSDGYATEEGSYKVIVKKANLIESNINIIKSYDFDNMPHSPVITSTLINNANVVVKYYTNSTYTNETQTPSYTKPGNYTIYFGIKDEENNYNEYNGSFIFTIIKQIKDIQYTVDDITKVYDGEAISNPNNIKVSDPIKGYSITYSLEENGVYETVINLVNASNIQKKVYYKINATDYNEVKGSFYVKINKAEIPLSYSAIIPNINFIYNGTSLGYELSLSSFLNDNKTKPDIYYSNINNISSFTKTPPKEINAGTYTKYYMLKDLGGNYNDSSIRTYSFKIEKREVEDDVFAEVSNNTYEYDANYKSATLTAPSLGQDIPDIMYSDEEKGEYTAQKPYKVNAGVYTLWYKLKESKNYLESSAKSYTLTINKRNITSANYTADNIEEVYNGIEKNAIVETKNILGNSDAIVTYADNSSGPFTSEVPKYKDVVNRSVYFKINIENYNEYIGSFSIKIKPAKINSANVIVPTKTEKYDGNPKTGLTGKIEVINLINNPKYNITFLNENGEYVEEIPTKIEPGKYSISYKIEVDNYIIYYDSYELYITTSLMEVVAESIVVDFDGKNHQVTPKVKDLIDYEIEYSEDGVNYRKDNYSYVKASNKPYTVYYRVTKNGYETFPGSFTITINMAEIKEENIVVTGNKGVYNNTFYLGNVAIDGLIGNQDAVVLYGLTHSGPFEDRSNLVGRKNAGSNTIYFKVIADNYKEYVSSYMVEIQKADFDDKVTVSEEKEEYDGTKKYGAKIDVGELLGKPNIIIYYKDNENSNDYYIERPYLIEPGTKTIWYKITAGNDYNEVYGQYTITVLEKEEQKFTVKFFDINGDELVEYRTNVSRIDEIVFPDEKIFEVENKIFLNLACKQNENDEDYILLSDMENDLTYSFGIHPLYIESYQEVTTITDINYFNNLDTSIDGISISVTFTNENGEIIGDDLTYGEYDVVIQIIFNGKIIKEEKIKNIKYTKEDEKDPGVSPVNISIYRLYNKSSGEHLFTTRIGEYEKLGNNGWIQEGKAFDAFLQTNKPENAIAVYRLYNKNGLRGLGDHHYTKSEGEINKLIKAGWTVDFNGEAAFYVSGDITVYKMYDDNSGAHHYTPKEGEKNKMSAAGWKVEGVAWMVNGYYNNNGTRISN